MKIAVSFQNPLAIMWTERFAVTWRTSNEMAPGENVQEWFRLNGEWTPMPAFTFEKISPPVRRTPNAPVANKKQRGMIGHMLNRLVEARAKRSLRKGRQKKKA
jgi:hypothetical protein